MSRHDPHGDYELAFTFHDQSMYRAPDKEKVLPTQDSKKHAPTGILRLSDEVLSALFQYVASDQDLAQVCKVCMRFNAAALPWLYKYITVTIGPKMSTPELHMFLSENRGLQHVRYVHVIVENENKFSKESELFRQSLQIVINHLPTDRLKDFRWHSRQPLPADLVLDLWKRQKNLVGLEIIPVTPDYRRLLNGHIDLRKQMKSSDLPKLTWVQVVLDTVNSAMTANTAIQCGNVSCLKIDALLWVGPDAREQKPEGEAPDPDTESDNETEPHADDGSIDADPKFPVIDPLTARLFHHLPRVKPGLKPPTTNLTQLIFADVNLTLSKHTWFAYLNLIKPQTSGTQLLQGRRHFPPQSVNPLSKADIARIGSLGRQQR